ncbi:MAG: DUF2961 domain-containing protein [Clostridiales bacterium]|nr:DUF2961 domain-containing protein [Clostridiales bacterium]
MLFENKPLFTKPEGIETRWASPENPNDGKGKAAQSGGSRKGSPYFSLKAGESHVLVEEKEVSGTVRRIWVTISERDIAMLRGLRLDFYWDGCLKPAVSSPLGDFFGTGLGRTTAFQSLLFTNPEGKSFNCYIPMPFKKGMKMIVTNESDRDLGAFYYDIDYTIGDKHGDDVLYFHAHYRRESPTTMQKDYEILPNVCGNGRYLGCNIGVIANKELYSSSWWGEGEVKVYLDGDTEYPTLSGTGTEDYIGTGWGQGRYDNLFQGCHIADHEKLQYCFYRYHISDPVYFSRDIRVTIQQIGCWGPDTKPFFHYNNSLVYSTNMEKLDFSKSAGLIEYGLFERQDDWSSCVYFYLNSPENNLPEIDAVEKRIK